MTYQQRLKKFEDPFQFKDLEFKIVEFDTAISSTHIVPDVKIESVHSKLNGAFGAHGWNFEITGQMSFEFNGKTEYTINAVLSIKGEEGEWINKPFMHRIKEFEDLENATEILLKRCVLMFNAGNGLLNSYPKIMILGDIRNLSGEHIKELEALHKAVTEKKDLGDLVKLGTGEKLNFSSFQSKKAPQEITLDAKQIDFLYKIASEKGILEKIKKDVSEGIINTSNYSESVLHLGYTGQSESNEEMMKLSTEQIADLELVLTDLENLGVVGIHDNTMAEIEDGVVNASNYNEIYNKYKSKVENLKNQGYGK